MDIPRDKNYPPNAIQCDECGGHGCGDNPAGNPCASRGWVLPGHVLARYCYSDTCNNPIPPSQVAVYCTNECAMDDA